MMDIMKIVLISTYVSGGAGKACMRLAYALRTIGHEVKVLAAENGGEISLVKQIGSKKKFIITWFLERLFFLFYESSKKVRWSFSPGIFGIDISLHPAVLEADIIHLHWINNGFLSLKNIAQLQTLWKPIVWTLHDMWVFTWGCYHSGSCTRFREGCGNCWYLRKPSKNDLSTFVFRKKKNLFMKKSWQFVTCSNWLRDKAQTSLLLSSYSVTTIPNTIDTNIFQPKEMSQVRDELHLPKNKKILLFIAQNIKNEQKGFKYILSMLQTLKKNNIYTKNDISLVIVGKGDQIVFDKLEYPVHHLGMIEDDQQIVKIYWACDVLIMPSLEENLPNVIMESLACGTPILAFPTGGIPEMVTHYQHWYIAKREDIDDLVSGLQWILNMSPEQCRLLRLNCVKKVQDSYTYENVANQYSNLYKKVV